MRRFPIRESLIPCLLLALVVGVAACGASEAGQAPDISTLQTAAERSGFEETTRYDDVVALMEAFAAASDRLHMTTFGYTYEGRPMPMIVVGDVTGPSAEEVLATGKTRVWVQGGIHSGEACGKEAMLMLLRDLAQGAHPEWDDSLVLLIAPLYNADGNELVKVDNRGGQNGPIAGMGQRPNAQGYDLNRDHMKIDSPEARSLVGMMDAYDPHLAIDLHTTNGTRHAYYVTYSHPMHPATDARIIEVLRNDLLPALTTAIKEKHGWDYYYYGNAGGFGGRGGRGGRGGGPAPTPVWRTFDYRARFNNNYVGLRNRFALLSEAYSYATWEDRIMASKWFVEEAVNYAAANAEMIRDVVAAVDADSIVGTRLAVTATPKQSSEQVEILMGETENVLNPYTGRYVSNRLNVVNPVMMFEAGTFDASAEETVPAAYFVPADQRDVLIKLQVHGIQAEPLGEEVTLQAERFRITSSIAAERPFQQHNELTLEGAWEATEVTLPADTMVVLIDQPLGRLAFSLLEPRAADGFTNWNFFDRALQGAEFHPVIRTSAEFRR